MQPYVAILAAACVVGLAVAIGAEVPVPQINARDAPQAQQRPVGARQVVTGAVKAAHMIQIASIDREVLYQFLSYLPIFHSCGLILVCVP